jgi:pimeloyl-ACP methyl ester carboxylesterase
MIESNLKDFYPIKKYKRNVLIYRVLFLLVYLISFIISAIYLYKGFWIFSILWICGMILFVFINIVVSHGAIATNWDDIDYSGFQKINLDFMLSDSIKHYAYLYIPTEIDISKTKRPVIIGFHGWNSQHREMDKYCLPTAREEKYLYFTLDARGHGNSGGEKSDFTQFDDSVKFIDMILNLPYVDNTKIAVVGFSMGAAQCAYAAYDHPYVKACVMLSGPYDLYFTRKNLSFLQNFLFKLTGCKFPKSDEIMMKYNPISKFKAEGVKLAYEDGLISNSDRVYLIANRDDHVVSYINTEKAIEKLKISEDNYRIYQKGKHCFVGNEYFLSLEIYRFLKKCLKH